MKKFLLIFSFLSFILFVYSQDNFAKYYCSTYQQHYNIEISIVNDTTYLMFVDVPSLDILCERTGFNLTPFEHDDFINVLKNAKKKYIEWKNVAINNNVKDFSKKIETDFKFFSVYFYSGGELHLQVFKEPIIVFLVKQFDGKQKYLLVIYSGEIESSSNEYLTIDGFSLVFSSEIEIQNFINMISNQNIKKYINKPKTEDLFK